MAVCHESSVRLWGLGHFTQPTSGPAQFSESVGRRRRWLPQFTVLLIWVQLLLIATMVGFLVLRSAAQQSTSSLALVPASFERRPELRAASEYRKAYLTGMSFLRW